MERRQPGVSGEDGPLGLLLPALRVRALRALDRRAAGGPKLVGARWWRWLLGRGCFGRYGIPFW